MPCSGCWERQPLRWRNEFFYSDSSNNGYFVISIIGEREGSTGDVQVKEIREDEKKGILSKRLFSICDSEEEERWLSSYKTTGFGFS